MDMTCMAGIVRADYRIVLLGHAILWPWSISRPFPVQRTVPVGWGCTRAERREIEVGSGDLLRGPWSKTCGYLWMSVTDASWQILPEPFFADCLETIFGVSAAIPHADCFLRRNLWNMIIQIFWMRKMPGYGFPSLGGAALYRVVNHCGHLTCPSCDGG